MSRPPVDQAPVVFEPEFADGLCQLFEQQVVFNRVIGLKLLNIAPEGVQGRIEMREELIGHFGHRRIQMGERTPHLRELRPVFCRDTCRQLRPIERRRYDSAVVLGCAGTYTAQERHQ